MIDEKSNNNDCYALRETTRVEEDGEKNNAEFYVHTVAVHTRSSGLKSAIDFIISVRFLLALLSFLAYCIQYMQRMGMSIGIVCMVNNKALDELNNKSSSVKNLTNLCDLYSFSSPSASTSDSVSSSNHRDDGKFVWDKEIQGWILTAYFAGQMTAQIPGGWLSLVIGGKKILAFSLVSGSIFNMLSPLFAKWDYKALIACRYIVGLFHSACWPSLKTIWAFWAPPNERSRLIGISTAGSNIGNIIALNLGSYLCLYGFGEGWPSIFYIFGILGIVWFVLFMTLASDSPETHKFISEKERAYIVSSTCDIASSNKIGSLKTPWKSIFSSKVCLVTFFCHLCHNWGNYLFFTQLPTYMKEVLRFDISSNGLLSSVPYICFTVVIILSGLVGDKILQKNLLSRTHTRKLFTAIGFFVPCVAIIFLSFLDCKSRILAVILLAVGIGATGCFYGGGLFVNINDIAGSYSGVVFAISNTISTVGGIISSYTGPLLTKNGTQKEWQIVLLMCAIFYFLGGLFNTLFSDSEVQEWALLSSSSKVNNGIENENEKDDDENNKNEKEQNKLQQLQQQINPNKDDQNNNGYITINKSKMNGNGGGLIREYHDNAIAADATNTNSSLLIRSDNNNEYSVNGNLAYSSANDELKI